MLPLLALVWSAVMAVSGGPGTDQYVGPAVDAWQQGDPVYVSPDSGALGPDDASALRGRIDGWRDDVWVAVLPAAAIRQDDAQHDASEASTLVDDLYAANGQRAGIYLVNVSGAGTYAAGYGDAAGTQEVARVLADQLQQHTLGQVDQVLDGTLDELGAPGGGGGHTALLIGAVVVALLLLGGGLALALRLRAGSRTSNRGETWGGPADYRPSFPTYDDQQDSVEERAALAREDLTRLGEELDAADPDVADPMVREHVLAALDAYADASRRVDSLTTDDELRQLGEVAAYARWQLATAQASLRHEPLPPRRVPCFIDASHGISVADVTWAPPGGVARPVPVCQADYDRITGGHR